MNTRKHPRTLQEAFGPYTSNEIEEDPYVPFGWQEIIVVIASLLSFWVLVALMVFE